MEGRTGHKEVFGLFYGGGTESVALHRKRSQQVQVDVRRAELS